VGIGSWGGVENLLDCEGICEASAVHFAEGDIDDIGEAITIEDLGDGVSDIEHEHAESAVIFVWAGAAFVSGDTDARNGGEWAIDQADDLTENDLAGGFSEGVTAGLSALGLDEAPEAELGEDLFEKLYGKTFFGNEFTNFEHGATHGIGDAKIDQSSEGIFASFGEFHRDGRGGLERRLGDAEALD